MLKIFFQNLTKNINGLKTAERRLLFLILIGAVIALSVGITKLVTDNSRQDKINLENFKKESSAAIKDLQKRCDACEDARFSDKLEQIDKLEKQSHQKDSLLQILRQIK